MNIHESAEDYLEAIYMQTLEKGYVRSIDIANALGYSKPSVSVAMKQLEENGYIDGTRTGFCICRTRAWLSPNAYTSGMRPWPPCS